MSNGEGSILKQHKIVNENFTSFCDLFRFQVRTNPHAVAVIFEGSSLTYQELDYRSSQLAGFLRANGVKSETIVALSLHNSLDLLVGILGIFKSGGAYLPIDPNYPAERIESILEDAKPVILLTEERLNDKFSFLPYKIVLMNKLPSIEHISQGEFIQANHLAYVIYTSGSTGKPKGIMVEHEALSHAALVYRELHPNRLVSLMSGSISFDASLLVISHTLTSGGTVCVPKNEMGVDPEQIIALIERHMVNYTLCVPSFYSIILSKSQKLSSLQSVDLGGESIPNDIPDIHAKIAPNAVLYNVYGPSEYSVGATFAKIYDPVTKQINKISIGKPLPKTQVYILDENLQPASTGVKGEIFIGGEGLARGYLNKEDLSKEKFTWVSFPEQDPIRLYKTGDFGRFSQDGTIEFLGRMDHQVKIRGYRIELGEVEYFICQHPEVNEAVVIVQEEKRLAAYFFAKTKEAISEKLRTYLQNMLPQHMIPSALIQVDCWPRTPNGKIDRRALSNFPEQHSKKVSFEEPLSGMELTLFQIWQQVLGRDTFGVKDNFFHLGGDSLQIVNVHALLQETLDFKVNISNLFQYPTISQLAHHLSSEKTDDVPSSKLQELTKKQKSAFQQFRKLSNRD
ncbi:MAG: non-ribosomal peptide synthetase [Rhabdochlamydiaceae bacterium]|jgi:amino acid adenylation domain-containing protein